MKIEDVIEYPLVKKLHFKNKIIVLKYLPFEKKRLQWLESVYEKISSKENISYPIKNTKNNFISKINNKYFVLFEFLENINNNLFFAEWWATTLFTVHSIDFDNNETCITQDLKDTQELFAKSSKFMSYKTIDFLNELMKNKNQFEKTSPSLVLNHGDPLYSNVLMDESNYILIDFENSFLAPKEYDIQRHLCDYAIHSDSSSDFKNYCKSFFSKYEKLGGIINWNLLIHLFKLDFCRTFSWLHIVIQDKERKDYKRQVEEIQLFFEAVEHNRISDMIKEFEVIKEGAL